jgi:predicted nucleic acid-binding protein
LLFVLDLFRFNSMSYPLINKSKAALAVVTSVAAATTCWMVLQEVKRRRRRRRERTVRLETEKEEIAEEETLPSIIQHFLDMPLDYNSTISEANQVSKK